ncbi:MAG: endo-1,4-beta-xylanase, partial [Bacteroidales bacterium]|nr:endo-1,4-beta-xylanase [Bacteroidales bacterium]
MTPLQLNNKFLLIPRIILIILTVTISCNREKEQATTLKDAFKEDFTVGAALSWFQITGRDTLSVALVKEHFNAITAGNVMKWERIHPRPGKYNFGPADQFVAFGEENQMQIVGHTLLWHSQTPQWVFQDSEGNLASRDTLLSRLHDHIHTVVGRYRGKVHCWDVVNEAMGDDGEIRNTLWYQIIGEDFLEKAFTFAREADPDAVLMYNDYSLPNPAKRDGVVKMIKDLQSKGIKVDAIGLQAHYHLDDPTLENLEACIVAFSDLGVKLMITELDVSVLPWPSGNMVADINLRLENNTELNPYTDGLPDSVQTVLANRYRDLFTMFSKHSEHIERVTFWGIHDGTSWKNNFPVRGRTNYPLLFDRSGQPKPAFDAVM